MSQIPVIAVVGPTASGKTRLAVELALHYGGEVVSADSMQLYQGMAIGTAQPTHEEMRGIPHHLIGVRDPAIPCSVAEYVAMAKACITDIHARGKVPVVAGGTGLYVDSLLAGRTFEETERNDALRIRLRQEADAQGGQALLDRLAGFDPETAAKLHPHNLGRIIRAIEVYETDGVTMSELQRRSKLTPSPYRTCKIGLGFADRAMLYAKIDARVDAMLEAGLLEEARVLFARADVRDSTAMQAIGYKELAAYLRGDCPLEQAVEDLKRATRRYAKRQMTWFRRAADICWIEAGMGKFEIICEQAVRGIDKSNTLCYNE
ncbi:MAG: tRNA (adenosine(37)-N6)-dimethylallyltransferase MiaA [Ethanoligenens sp.]